MTAEQAKRLENIPDALKQCARWMCWKAEPNPKGGHARKAPRSPKTGQIASKTDPAARGTFAEAATACAMYGLDGVGFVFEAGCGFVAVDLDDIGDRMNRDEAQRIVNTLQSYTESSYSGRGAHIVCAGSIPDNFNLSQAQGLEMYGGRSRSGSSGAAFLALTGNRLNGYELRDSSAELAQLHADYSRRAADQRGNSVRTEAQQQPAATTSGSRLTDSEILAKAMQSAEFAALWAGDLTRAGGDHSSADYSLAGKLMFWTGRDIEQADRLFRQSGLMRDKWDRPTSGSTYGRITLERAAANCATVYGDRRQLDTAAAERAAMPGGDQSGGSSVRTEAQTAQPISFESTADYIRRKGFAEHLQDSAQDGELVTGFAQLDDLMCGWHFGLHAIGGAPGAGKTAFCLQMCDQISAAGRDCIYFSLEVPAGDMLARSLSRLTIQRLDALPCGESDPRFDPVTYSALDILRGRAADQLDSLQADYLRNVGGRVHIIDRKLTTAEICSTVRQYVQQTGRKPCIFIDYLQLVAQISAAAQQDAKAATDAATEAFTQLAKDLQLHIFVISSINRMGYNVPATMELFKESGSIEFSAVSAMILQLAAVYDQKPKYDKKGEKTGTRAPTTAELDEERQQRPRRLDLAILKSRYGKGAGSHLRLEYYSRCDYFIEQAQDCAHSTAAAELAADQSDDQTSAKGGGDTWTAAATG